MLQYPHWVAEFRCVELGGWAFYKRDKVQSERDAHIVERARPDLTLESRETTVKYIWANSALNIQNRNTTQNTKNMACDESHSLNTYSAEEST